LITAYCTISELATALRIKVTVDNTDSLQRCVDAAAMEIDDCIDRPPGDPVPLAGWLFDQSTQAADPGDGQLRLNKTNPQAVSAIYLDPVDTDGTDLTVQVGELAPNDLLRLYDTGGRFEQFTLTGPPVDNGGWFTLPVSRTGSSSSPLQLEDGMALTVAVLHPTPLLVHQLALANRINILRGVEWWKSNDAAVGAAVGMDQSGVFTAPRSSFMTRHGGNMVPLKQQWGVA